MGAVKDKITKLFADNPDKIYYYSDIAMELDLDLEETVNACNELMDEGKIEVADSKSVQRRLTIQTRERRRQKRGRKDN